MIVLGVDRLHTTFSPNLQHVLQVGTVFRVPPLVIGFVDPLAEPPAMPHQDPSVPCVKGQIVDLMWILPIPAQPTGV